MTNVTKKFDRIFSQKPSRNWFRKRKVQLWLMSRTKLPRKQTNDSESIQTSRVITDEVNLDDW